MAKNDDRILLLKEQIDEKKKSLNELKTAFVPKTNLVLNFEGNTYNLNVCNVDELKILLIRLNMYIISANDLCIGLNEIVISGYPIESWVDDIGSKIRTINIKKDELELKAYEEKLNKMLSEDKKTELELDKIEELLK